MRRRKRKDGALLCRLNRSLVSFKHQSTNPNHTLTLDTRTPVHWQGCGDNQMAGDNTGHFHHKIKKKAEPKCFQGPRHTSKPVNTIARWCQIDARLLVANYCERVSALRQYHRLKANRPTRK